MSRFVTLTSVTVSHLMSSTFFFTVAFLPPCSYLTILNSSFIKCLFYLINVFTEVVKVSELHQIIEYKRINSVINVSSLFKYTLFIRH